MEKWEAYSQKVLNDELSFGQLLKILAKTKGLKQSDIAKALGKSRQYISRVFSSDTFPPNPERSRGFYEDLEKLLCLPQNKLSSLARKWQKQHMAFQPKNESVIPSGDEFSKKATELYRNYKELLQDPEMALFASQGSRNEKFRICYNIKLIQAIEGIFSHRDLFGYELFSTFISIINICYNSGVIHSPMLKTLKSLIENEEYHCQMMTERLENFFPSPTVSTGHNKGLDFYRKKVGRPFLGQSVFRISSSKGIKHIEDTLGNIKAYIKKSRDRIDAYDLVSKFRTLRFWEWATPQDSYPSEFYEESKSTHTEQLIKEDEVLLFVSYKKPTPQFRAISDEIASFLEKAIKKEIVKFYDEESLYFFGYDLVERVFKHLKVPMDGDREYPVKRHILVSVLHDESWFFQDYASDVLGEKKVAGPIWDGFNDALSQYRMI